MTRRMIQESINGFIHGHSADWTTNRFNDDIMWITIACARGYLITGNKIWRDAARQNFDAVFARGYNDMLGGGLYWSTRNQSKNACVNGPAAIAACLLCQIYSDNSYLDKAEAIYTWERNTLFNPSTGAIYDNISVNGHIGHKSYTYNEGTFIGAADLLWKLTGDTNYLNDALLAANFTRKSLAHRKTLPDYGSAMRRVLMVFSCAGWRGLWRPPPVAAVLPVDASKRQCRLGRPPSR